VAAGAAGMRPRARCTDRAAGGDPDPDPRRSGSRPPVAGSCRAGFSASWDGQSPRADEVTRWSGRGRSCGVRAGLQAHLSSRQVSRVVYGAIVGLALVVAVDKHPPAAGVMAAWLVMSGIAVALAELYSE